MDLMRKLLLSLLLLPAVTHAEETLVLGTIPNTDAPLLRICEAVLDEAYGQLGIRLQIERMPANRVTYQALHGLLDGELCRATESPGLLKIDVPLATLEISAASHKPLPIRAWEDLRGYRVNYERGIRVIELRADALGLQPANNLRSALLQLQHGRIDVHLSDYQSIRSMASQLDLNDRLVIERNLESLPMYHLLGTRHRALQQPLTEVLQQMQQQGRIAAISATVLERSTDSPAARQP